MAAVVHVTNRLILLPFVVVNPIIIIILHPVINYVYIPPDVMKRISLKKSSGYELLLT